MVRTTFPRAVAMAAVLLLVATLAAFGTDAEEGWNEGTISLHASPEDEVTVDGYPVRTGTPGTTVSFDLIVSNSADVTQTAVLWLHKPDEWHCVLTGSLVLAPGSSGNAMLMIDIPNTKDVDPDGSYTFRVEAVGNATGDRAFILAVLDIRATVDHTFLLYPYNTHEWWFQVYPGERTFMDVLLRNTGHIADSYSLTIGEHRTDWDIQFREGTEELSMDLAPPEFENIYMTRLEVAVPSQALPGEELDLVLDCRSELATEHGTGRPYSRLTLHITVVHGSSIELVPELTWLKMDAGKVASLTVEVSHSGFIGCSYEPMVQILQGGVPRSDWTLEIFSEGDRTLDNGERESFDVFIRSPETGCGEYALLLGASSQEATVRSTQVSIMVVPVTEIAMENFRGGPFVSMEDMEVAFDLVNLGQVRQEVVLSISDLPDGFSWESEPEGPMRLEPGYSRPIKISVYAQESAERSPFDLKIKCLAADPRGGGMLEAANASHRIEFMDLPDATVLSVDVPDGQVNEGDMVHINVTIRNNGPLDIRSLDIMFYEVTFSLSRLEIGRNTTNVPAGGTMTINIRWSARPSAQSIRVEAVLPSGTQDSNPADNSMSRPVYVLPSKGTSGPDGDGSGGSYIPAGAALAGALGVGTLAGLFIFIINTDLFRYPFFFTFYPLYSKLRPETLLSNRLRKRIYVYVQNNPGEHFRSILVKLNLTNGTLAHHLYTLEKEDLIRSEKDGLYRRFYPAGYNMVEAATRLSTIQQSILECIIKRPGLSQKDVAGLLSLSNSTVNYNVKVLEEKKVIECRRVGKSTSLYTTKDHNS